MKINFKDELVHVKEISNQKKVCPTSENADQEPTKTEFFVQPTNLIDFVSFWVHFSSFLIFNIIYWIYNLDWII